MVDQHWPPVWAALSQGRGWKCDRKFAVYQFPQKPNTAKLHKIRAPENGVYASLEIPESSL